MRYLSFIIFAFLLSGCGETTSASMAKAPIESLATEGAIDINPLNDPTPLAEMITLDGLGPGAQLVSPYTLKGKAIGAWYNEGSFPVVLVGEDGRRIASSPAQATEPWMRAGWVAYQSKLTWLVGPGTKAKLILTLDNPGAAEGEGRIRAIEIPVVLR